MITILIVITTVIVSIISFQRSDVFSKLYFQPFLIYSKNEFFRFISHTFVHADWIHLIVNMLVFFSFGRYVEQEFLRYEMNDYVFSGRFFYLILYFGGAVVASIPSYLKHKDNPNYISVGASGAVSAILFTSIFISPLDKVYFYGILPIPGIVFGILYLIYSSYMGRRANDNINHDAHFWGAIFGFVFPVILKPGAIAEFINHF